MRKFMTTLFLVGITLVCFDSGDKFCVNPEHVTAVIKGTKGTMIITRDGELITNEDYDKVVKKIRDGQ